MRTRSILVLASLLSLTAAPAAAATRVKIDILPGEPGNLIAREPGEVVEVAVLGSAELDATALLPESLRLAGATIVKDDAGTTHVLKDVNGDGRLDLIVRFLARDLRLADGATHAVLNGTTREGIPVEGEDAVRTVADALGKDLQRASADDEKLPHLTVEVQAVPGKPHTLAVLGSDELPAREIVLGSVRLHGQPITKSKDNGELGTYADVNGDGREDLVLAAPPGVETDGTTSVTATTRTGRILDTETPGASMTERSDDVLAPTASPFTLFGQNPAVITIPDSGSASPYPSTIQVSGVSGVISKIRVTLQGVTHTCFADLDVLLVAPNGQSLVLTSDAGGCGGAPTPTRLTFDDYAPATLSNSAIPGSGSYRPTNYFGFDTFPAPAPAPTQASAMSVFQGIDPNGTWKLYVVDDAGGDQGSIAGGWTLDLVTSTRVCNLTPLTIADAGASAMSWITLSGLPHRMVKVAVTLNDLTHQRPDDLDVMLVTPNYRQIMLMSDAGGTGNFVAQLTFDDDAAWGPLADDFSPNSGTYLPVDYEPGESLPAPAPVGAGFTSLGIVRGEEPNGTWQLFIADDTAGAGGGTLAGGWCVDVTAVAPMEGCAPAAVAIPGIAGSTSGAGAPYPSTIQINNTSGFVEGVEVKLLGLTHTYPDDLDILLQSPSGRTLPLMSDSGGGTDVNNLNVTFSTSAQSDPGDEAPLGAGPYYPTNYNGFDGDAYPPPAPAPNATGWSDRELPNGNWNLWVADDAAADVGTLAGGWCLSLKLWEPTYSTCTDGAHPITIPSGGTSGWASSYPWSFQALQEGMSIRKIKVRIENLSHTWPDDLDMILVGPTGQHAVLMSDAGGNGAIVERTLTFDDDDFNAPPIPDFGQIVTGTYHTANYDGGDIDNWSLGPGPFFTGLYNFRGTDPRGQWNLYIVDDATSDVGGAVRWCIDFFAAYPPAEVTQARWLSKNFLIWDVAVNASEYAVLRGTPADLPNLPSSAPGCNAGGGPGQGAAGLFSDPPPGSFFWYLVQGRNEVQVPGPVGSARIAGVDTPRTVNETGYCPAP